eukprot:1986818-Amphidinium_carterae.2
MQHLGIDNASTTDVTDYCMSIGAVDPRRLFGKNELHGAKKARERKWRLIWGISFVDEIVEHVVTKQYNNLLPRTPSSEDAPGKE